MTDLNKSNYDTDQPKRSTEDDYFDRNGFAKRIADTIATRNNTSNFVVAIYGAWGEGKTTVLNFVDVLLQEQKHIKTVWFNPWQFSSDPHTFLVNFILTLGRELQKTFSGDLGKKVGKWVKDYGTAATSPLSLFGLGALKDIAEQVGKILDSPYDITKLKAEFDEILSNSDKFVVVFMDDIDRLDRSEIQLLFKMIKLSTNFNRLIYVLAFDDSKVASALGQQYGAGDEKDGREFLEKIIQVPLRLPAVDPALMRRFFYSEIERVFVDLAVSLPDNSKYLLFSQLSNGIESRLSTPRMIHRYCNALRFAIPMLLDEVDIIDQVLIEGIRVCYPELYDILRLNPEILLQQDFTRANIILGFDPQGSRSKELYGKISERYDKKPNLDVLIQYLFPKFADRVIKQRTTREILDGNREQRICSKDYFQRYFSYTVTRSDIADARVVEFINDVANQKLDLAQTLLNGLSFEVAGLFLRKIESKLSNLYSGLAGKIAILLSTIGAKYSIDERTSFFNTIKYDALLLIRQLVEKVDSTQRHIVIKGIIESAEPIDFAFELSEWLLTDETDPLVHETDLLELNSTISNRIEKFFSTNNLTDYTGNLSSAFIQWSKWGSRDQTNQYLKRQLDNDPVQVSDFLSPFFAELWQRFIGRFPPEEAIGTIYAQILTVVDGRFVYQAIEQLPNWAQIQKMSMPENEVLQKIPPEMQHSLNVWLFATEYQRRQTSTKTNTPVLSEDVPETSKQI